MKDNFALPAMPLSQHMNNRLEDGIWDEGTGITKREYFAGIALQGLCVNVGRNGFHDGDKEALAQASLDYADAILKAIEATA